MASLAALERVEERVLDLTAVPVGDREAVWRAMAVGGFDVTGLPGDLAASAVGYQLGSVRFSDSVYPVRTLHRSSARVRSDVVDAIMCSIELSSGFGAVVGDTEQAVGTGQVTFGEAGAEQFR